MDGTGQASLENSIEKLRSADNLSMDKLSNLFCNE